jgi:glycosyltransferase involved in cell wall biosynthesis
MSLSLEVLISTMYRRNKEEVIHLLNEMNIDSDCVIINQCDKNGEEYFEYNKHKITLIYSTERGLSKSRNLALQYAKADVVVIADDDVKYVDGYVEIVTRTYESHSGDDVLIFHFEGKKNTMKNEKKLNRFLIGRINSIQITMRLKSVENIRFNVLFGSGSDYYHHGEEVLFLNECITKGKQIRFISIVILYLLDGRPSTWFHGYDKEYFIDQGAFYYEFSPIFAPLLVFQFALRKINLYKSELSMIYVIFYMFMGIREYIKVIKK